MTPAADNDGGARAGRYKPARVVIVPGTPVGPDREEKSMSHEDLLLLVEAVRIVGYSVQGVVGALVLGIILRAGPR